MLEVAVNRDLVADTDRAWTLLADWGNTPWIEGPEKCELFDSAEGLVRRFHLPGRAPVDEILLATDPDARQLRYRIPRCEALPFDDYHGTIAVNPRPGGGCRVDWHCRFGAGGLSESDALARAQANLERLLQGLADHLETCRVVQWATGKVGISSLRAVIRHPRLELVGLHVHSEAKLGRDAGELCGLGPTGVRATGDLASILALRPDCVLYMQEGYDLDDLCALLQAGINVVTTRGEFFNPGRMDPPLRERIEEACRRGGASLHATGSSPGFITEALPLVLTSVARRLDCLTIDEFADIPASCSTDMILHVMGYGRPLEEALDPNLLAHMAQCFEDSLGTIADALALPVDRFEVYGETAAGRERVELTDGAAIEAGTVAAIRITVAGIRDGKPLMRFRSNWYCTRDIDADWHLEDNGWRVLVDGDAPLDVRIAFPRTEEPVADQMGGYTAFRAVNAVPYVCAAPPGIRTIVDLPQVVARLGDRCCCASRHRR
jgi:4-hydroxy-tetrahydrodipicolinate reductase